jgi:hypothetical protein
MQLDNGILGYMEQKNRSNGVFCTEYGISGGDKGSPAPLQHNAIASASLGPPSTSKI